MRVITLLIFLTACGFDATGTDDLDASARIDADAQGQDDVADATTLDADPRTPDANDEPIVDAATTLPDAWTGLPVGSDCDLFDDRCAPDLGCYWVGPAIGTCAEAGDGIKGEDCGFINDCAPGLACVDSGAFSCRIVCETASPTLCEPGEVSTPATGADPAIGVCL
jgi:hypothetical protein